MSLNKSFNMSDVLPELCGASASTAEPTENLVAHHLAPNKDMPFLEALHKQTSMARKSHLISPPSMVPSSPVVLPPPPPSVLNAQSLAQALLLMHQQNLARATMAQMHGQFALQQRIQAMGAMGMGVGLQFGRPPMMTLPTPTPTPLKSTPRRAPSTCDGSMMPRSSTFVSQQSKTNRGNGNTKRVYHCQRCLNHGLEFKRKDHKNVCQFQNCECEKCSMVNERRVLNKQLHNVQEQDNFKAPLAVDFSASNASSPTGQMSKGGIKDRMPNCQKCFQHKIAVRLKGHKRKCPYRNCPCDKCTVVQLRQKLMANQIKLRRDQKKTKKAVEEQLLQRRDVELAMAARMNLLNVESGAMVSLCHHPSIAPPPLMSPLSSSSPSYSTSTPPVDQTPMDTNERPLSDYSDNSYQSTITRLSMPPSMAPSMAPSMHPSLAISA